MTGISVIIPTLNRSEHLLQTLYDLSQQVFDYGFEIIVVDQSDQEDTRALDFAKQHHMVRYHFVSDFRGLPKARNFGASVAVFDYLLFLDDDISCDNTLLKEHYHALQPLDVGIVAGGITEKYKQNTDESTGRFNYWTASPKGGFHLSGDFSVEHAKGCNFSVKKDVFQVCSGIDERLSQGAALYEELDFCLRVRKAGHTVRFYSKAHVIHLAANDGGCRVQNIKNYFETLARNRSLVISRHLEGHHAISAYLYLFKLLCSYIIAYGNATLLFDFIKGVKDGYPLGKGQVVNSYETRHVLP